MYGHKIYTKIDQFLNHHHYPAEVPEYSVRKPDAVADGTFMPFGGVPDKNAMVLSRITIASMIDYCHNKIPFRILEKKDIIEIYQYLEEYINQLSGFHEIEEARDYLNRSLNFQSQLERSVRILSKRDPKVAHMLQSNALPDLFKSSIIPE